MKKNFTNKNFMSNLMKLAALFVIIFGAASCTDEHFITGEEPENPAVPNDTVAVMADFKLHHGAWSYANGLAKADHYYSGIIDLKVNGEVVDGIFIERENAPIEIKWQPIAETTSASAEKEYLGHVESAAKKAESHQNQRVNFQKYERECKLSFVGMELTLKASWYEASLLGKTAYCRYDSTTVKDQDPILLETIEKNGEAYDRYQITVKCVNHFTDENTDKGKDHTEPMNIIYTVLVPKDLQPGEKIYEGSIAGNGSYTKASEESYRSELKLTHIFVQDGQQIKEQETVSGTAVVKTWVETSGPKMVVPTIQIGNPSVNVINDEPSELYQKNGYIYAKKYTTTWTYTWANGFQKKVYSEVERLYYMREAGKEIEMPYGETSTSFKNFNAGNSVEKSENNKKYDAYPNGVVRFNGNHKSSTGNVNDAIEGLSVGQEFWIEKAEEPEEPEDPTTPDEWGRLDIQKTKAFGGLAWSWKNVGGKLVPFVSGTIMTEYGVISFWEGGSCFTKMDTNTITNRLSNSIKSEGPEYLIPAYIRVLTEPNKHWGYQDINGQYRDEINGADIELLPDVSIDKPFIAEGGNANVYNISANGNTVSVIITYNGKVLFSEVFAK